MHPYAIDLPSQKDLLDWFEYEPATGGLIWKNPPVNGDNSQLKKSLTTRLAGKRAGSYRTKYLQVMIFGRSYSGHRLIWKMHYGYNPITIDHINGNPSDNRIENLRSVTHQTNVRNMKIAKTNSSGLTGVAWESDRNKWRAQIEINRKCFTKRFDDFFEAVCFRKSREAKYGFVVRGNDNADQRAA